MLIVCKIMVSLCVEYLFVLRLTITHYLHIQVIQNDIDGHKESVDSLKEAGARVVAKEAGSDSPVKRKLNEINTMWGRVQEKCNEKYKRLKEALREVNFLLLCMNNILIEVF